MLTIIGAMLLLVACWLVYLVIITDNEIDEARKTIVKLGEEMEELQELLKQNKQ